MEDAGTQDIPEVRGFLQTLATTSVDSLSFHKAVQGYFHALLRGQERRLESLERWLHGEEVSPEDMRDLRSIGVTEKINKNNAFKMLRSLCQTVRVLGYTGLALLFDALLNAPENLSSGAFRPSIAIQQSFSLLKQSPSGAVRLNPFADVFAGTLCRDDLHSILGELQALGYLKSGRMGKWRADERLNRLVDLQSAENTPLSLHSNIQSGSPAKLKIREQQSQRIVASVDRQWLDRDVLTVEGRPVNVEWYDGEALWVSAYRGADQAEQLHYCSARQMLSYELAQQLPAQIGLSSRAAPPRPTLLPYGFPGVP